MERSITEKINIRATAKRIERLSIVFDELPEIIKLMDNEEREALSKEYEQLEKAFLDCIDSEIKYCYLSSR